MSRGRAVVAGAVAVAVAVAAAVKSGLIVSMKLLRLGECLPTRETNLGREAGVPIPEFARVCGLLFANFGIKRDTSN